MCRLLLFPAFFVAVFAVGTSAHSAVLQPETSLFDNERSSIEAMEAKISELEQTLQTVQSQLPNIAVSKISRTTPVAFTAYRPQNSVQQNKAFVFRYTRYNAGIHYNTRDGSFTAPVSGTYLFSSTIVAKGSGSMSAHIVTGKSLSSARIIGYFYTELPSGQLTSASDTCVAHINSGDKVWVKNYDVITAYSPSSFMGVLLQED